MRKPKGSMFLTIIVAIVTVVSLVSCLGSLGVSNSLQGTSIKKEQKWNVSIDSISEIGMDEGAIEVLKQPVNDNYKVSYGIKLNRSNSVAQFCFTFKNDGNIDAIVKDIKINGLDTYNQNVKVTLDGIKIGDVIKGESLTNVKVVTSYIKQVTDELMVPQVIELDNIEVDVILDK